MEKKTVLIVWDDWYHPEANYREAVRKSFEENELWNVIKTHRVRDLLEMEPKPDLCIHFTVGCPEGEDPRRHKGVQEKEGPHEEIAGMAGPGPAGGRAVAFCIFRAPGRGLSGVSCNCYGNDQEIYCGCCRRCACVRAYGIGTEP